MKTFDPWPVFFRRAMMPPDGPTSSRPTSFPQHRCRGHARSPTGRRRHDRARPVAGHRFLSQRQATAAVGRRFQIRYCSSTRPCGHARRRWNTRGARAGGSGGCRRKRSPTRGRGERRRPRPREAAGGVEASTAPRSWPRMASTATRSSTRSATTSLSHLPSSAPQPDTVSTSRHRASRSAAAQATSTLGMLGNTTAPPRCGRGLWPRSSWRWTSPRTDSRYRGVCSPNPFHPPARRDPQAAMDLRSSTARLAGATLASGHQLRCPSMEQQLRPHCRTARNRIRTISRWPHLFPTLPTSPSEP